MIPYLAHHRRTSEPGAFSRGLLLVGTLFFALAVVGVLVLLRLNRDRVRSEAAATLDSLRHASRSAAVLLAPNARLAMLSPTPSGPPDGRGRATYDPATQSLVLVFDRLRDEPSSTPVLWALSDEKPRFLAVLEPDASGRAVLLLDEAGATVTLDALAVSLEPDSLELDQRAPGGPVILLGILER